MMLVLAQGAMLVYSAVSRSATFDEPAHLNAGLSYFSVNRMDLYCVNPPLFRLIGCGFPGLAGERACFSERALAPSRRAEFTLGYQYFKTDPEAALRNLRIARISLIPIALAGLVLCVRCATDLFGQIPGVAAGVLWCFSPFILGHGALLTADVSSATAGLLVFWGLRRWQCHSCVWNSLLLGAAVGAAVGTKFTWVAALGPWLVFSHLYMWVRLRDYPLINWALLFKLIFIASVAIAFINGLYGFDRSFRPLGEIELRSEAFRAEGAPNRLSRSPVGLLPFPLPQLFLQGIDTQLRDFEHDRTSPSYLLGQWSDRGWYHYYIVGLASKCTLPFLGLLLIAGVLAGKACLRRKPIAVAAGQETACDSAILCLIPAAAVLLIVSMQTGFSRHVRYVIPALPFLYLFASSLFGGRFLQGKLLTGIVAGLLVLHGVASLSIAPNWISFFNVLVRATGNQLSVLSDSNIDWGQDLAELARWQQQHPDVTPVYLCVQSSLEPAIYGIDYEQAPQVLCEGGSGRFAIDEIDLPAGWYAVGANALIGDRWFAYDGNWHGVSCAGLPCRFPEQNAVAKIGGSIYVFEVGENKSPEE
jgi:hypothetical protein